MSKNFKQYDKQWGKKKYAGETMSAAGCGPTSVADIVYNKKKKITPWKVAKWLTENRYTSPGKGTYWSGITAALEHYGFKVKGYGAPGGDLTMKQFFKEMKKEDRWGILLMGSGTKGGVTWTTCGHFIMVNDYKKKGLKHYLYIHDPGARNHDGWYCYEKHMKGLCNLAYIAWLPEDEK